MDLLLAVRIITAITRKCTCSRMIVVNLPEEIWTALPLDSVANKK
jgi:hypothetical protein